MRTALIAATLCIILCGCVKERRPHVDIQECEARLSDIPILLNCRPLAQSISEKSFSYTTPKSEPELYSYYVGEMERFGWDMVGNSITDETVILFEKPYKTAVVSFRKGRKGSIVRIDLIQKSIKITALSDLN